MLGIFRECGTVFYRVRYGAVRCIHLVIPLGDASLVNSSFYYHPKEEEDGSLVISAHNQLGLCQDRPMTISAHNNLVVGKSQNRTKPNRTYGNYRTSPTEPTENDGQLRLSIPGFNAVTESHLGVINSIVINHYYYYGAYKDRKAPKYRKATKIPESTYKYQKAMEKSIFIACDLWGTVSKGILANLWPIF